MAFYPILIGATALVGLLAFMIWKKTQALMFPLGAFVLYFWSLHGAWAVLIDKLGGNSGLRYHYLETKLFPVFLNQSYFFSILYYTLFCVTVLLIVLANVARTKTGQRIPLQNRPKINHLIIVAFAAGLGLMSYILIADVMAEAVVFGQTGYAVVRAESVPFYTIHQILARASVVITLSGLALMLCRDRSIYFRANFSFRLLVLYLILASILIPYMMLLGNKNTLLGAFLTAGLIYASHNSVPRLKLISISGFVVLLFIGSVDYLRGFTILSTGAQGMTFDDFITGAFAILSSNEAYAAHFSMYGVLEFDIEPTLGKDILAFMLSVVPINIWPDRPSGVYEDYVAGVNAAEGLGYTIHHASAWYLDFGVVGILLGAIILGSIWVWLYNKFVGISVRKGHLNYVFFTIAPFAFAAYFPNIIRVGVSAYKGVVIEAFIIPVAIIYLATLRWKSP